MKMKKLNLYFLSMFCVFINVFGSQVSYSNRGIIIDGRTRILQSGSIHYPRSTPEMWPDLIQKSKDGGLDVIETYVFWDLHEPVKGQYNFQGRYDLVRFIKEIQKAGMYAHLRIGPYVCAEWNYGGFPLWLHFIEGIKFRTNNEPFKAEMQRFTEKIVSMMKEEKLFASQGGPIILSQIENEYGNVMAPYGADGVTYMNWAAAMAVNLSTGVPWVMGQQSNAPSSVINTCNGFYCDKFTPSYSDKPKIWTENWVGWFQKFGGACPYRPSEDLAYAVARFFQQGGSFQNYYMYHGGTNFARTSGGPFITTTYDYDAPLDEYGMKREPKWSHLKELHAAIKLCEAALISGSQHKSNISDGVEAYVYSNNSTVCAAFLANTHSNQDVRVNFRNQFYTLPAWSVSILPDCQNVVYNTAQVSSQTVSYSNNPTNVLENANWSSIEEPIGPWDHTAFSRSGLLEQINTTADSSDYLWYSIRVNISKGVGEKLQLYVQSLGHALHIFINGALAGGANGSSGFKVQTPVQFKAGINSIDLLSMTVGLAGTGNEALPGLSLLLTVKNYGAFYDLIGAGITGPVILKGLSEGDWNLSSVFWTYQIGLKGEKYGYYTGDNSDGSSWETDAVPNNKSMIWYKTTFEALPGNDPVALNLSSMNKGVAWVNGQSIGRYWVSQVAPQQGCTSSCDYRGSYSSDKCKRNCGIPSQTLYHVPRSWINPSGNVLVLFEEVGGDPTTVSFMTRSVSSLSAYVQDDHPAPVDSLKISEMGISNFKFSLQKPRLRLNCSSLNQSIKAITFASFGTPQRSNESFKQGHCHSQNTLAIVKKSCLGKQSCSIEVSHNVFGDPCPGKRKGLAVQAQCSESPLSQFKIPLA